MNESATDITVGGKTPEEIKKGIECCVIKVNGRTVKDCSIECPYFPEGVFCKNALRNDTLIYIRQLETGIDKTLKLVQLTDKQIRERLNEFESRLAQAERERDAARHDLMMMGSPREIREERTK